MRRRVFLSALLMTIVGCTSGDANPKTYPVTGTVMYNGKPVEGATVVFVPPVGGNAAFGTTDNTGKYQLTTFIPNDGAVPGIYKVKVTKIDAPKSSSGKVFANSDEEQAVYNPDAPPPPPAKNQLPNMYANQETSKLTHTVTTSPTTFDIHIK